VIQSDQDYEQTILGWLEYEKESDIDEREEFVFLK
jgi:hypothetical protein